MPTQLQRIWNFFKSWMHDEMYYRKYLARIYFDIDPVLNVIGKHSRVTVSKNFDAYISDINKCNIDNWLTQAINIAYNQPSVSIDDAWLPNSYLHTFTHKGLKPIIDTVPIKERLSSWRLVNVSDSDFYIETAQYRYLIPKPYEILLKSILKIAYLSQSDTMIIATYDIKHKLIHFSLHKGGICTDGFTYKIVGNSLVERTSK